MEDRSQNLSITGLNSNFHLGGNRWHRETPVWFGHRFAVDRLRTLSNFAMNLYHPWGFLCWLIAES